MKDNDLENQINVKLPDDVYKRIIEASERSGLFKGEIARKCIIRCIRQDEAPKWKRAIAKLIGY